MISPIILTPNMDMPTLVSAVNNTLRQIQAENRTKIIVDEDGDKRILIGAKPDGTYGIYITKPGLDVLEELGF